MNRFRIGWLSAVSLLLVTGVALAGDADFTLVNKTGYDLREVYISPTQKSQWGRDRLGEYILEHGDSRLFKFKDSANCRQDIRVVFDDDDSEAIWEDVDLCELNRITIKYNRKTGEVSAYGD